MDPGTVTLVISLARMGPEVRLLPFLIPSHHTGLHHPLALRMPSMEACLRVAERERARGNKAGCSSSEHHDTAPRDWWPDAPHPS
jgi:hypothetical protein